MKIIRFLFLCLSAMVYQPIAAQTLTYNVEMNGAITNGDYAPFWHTANRFGLGSTDTRSGYLRAGVAGNTKLDNSKWSFDYGLDLVGGYHQTSTLFVQQAYFDVNWNMFKLSIGQKERPGELKNQQLSTGALIESGNTRPIPQVRIEVPDYWDLFGTNGWFTLRGHLAYGYCTDGNWQEDFAAKGTRYSKGTRYHSKAFFLKGGNKDKFPLTGVLGFQSTALFSGDIYNYGNKEGKIIERPTRLSDYWHVFIPSSGDSETSELDQINIEGNQLGSWHGELAWEEQNWKVRCYYEHMFDDHSGMFFEYGLWKDGLVGIELNVPKFRWINNVVFEYFSSRDGSGPIYHDSSAKIPDQISSQDNYYNHYENPWIYYGAIMGSPLITSPIYNSNNRLEILNNRVEAFHIGISGQPAEEWSYRILLTKTLNWGTYEHPYTSIKDNNSGLIEISYSYRKFKEWKFTASFAFDNGELYGNNKGFMLSIKKTGLISL